jgi:nucleoside-diphosphate-sugar epimerase
LAAILSASGEKNPNLCFDVNVTGFKSIIDLALQNKARFFCPSTIAAFGPSTPKVNYNKLCRIKHQM